MALTVELEDEHGKRIDGIEDPTNILHRVLPSEDDASSGCLRYVDRYGDTVFNRRQIGDVLQELRRLSGKAQDKGEKQLLARLIDLALRCQSEPHLYLKFYGD